LHRARLSYVVGAPIASAHESLANETATLVLTLLAVAVWGFVLPLSIVTSLSIV
jgi:hypothetical protein